jgi:hypothetical protein
MGCCGQKRQAILLSPTGLSTETNERVAEGAADSNGPRSKGLFRYTGSSSLEVEGIFGRRVYKFSKEMPEQMIMVEDVAIMRAYPQLIELKSVRENE